MTNTVYDFSCQTSGGTNKSLQDYKGKVLLVVNTVSGNRGPEGFQHRQSMRLHAAVCRIGGNVQEVQG